MNAWNYLGSVRPLHPRRKTYSARWAFSLIEVVVTMTILAILVTFAAPSVMRTMEQSHADLAGASLRSIATAQRFYWLENRSYAVSLQELLDAELIDAELIESSPRYEFSIQAADANSFSAQARRRRFNAAGNAVYTGAWEGEFLVDESGVLTGQVAGPYSTVLGESPTLVPGF